MVNMLTLVMLPLVYVISQMHTLSHTHTHTGENSMAAGGKNALGQQNNAVERGKLHMY